MDINEITKKLNENITNKERTYLIGKLYKSRKKSWGGKRGNQYTKVLSEDNLRTSQIMAEEFNVGENTIRRAEKYTDAIDEIENHYGIGVKINLLQNKLNINYKNVIRLYNDIKK